MAKDKCAIHLSFLSFARYLLLIKSPYLPRSVVWLALSSYRDESRLLYNDDSASVASFPSVLPISNCCQ
jgi:hypothetical protein